MWVLRQYGAPAILAICLHVLAFLGLQTVWSPETRDFILLKPEIVRSQLLVLEQIKTSSPAISDSKKNLSPKSLPVETTPLEDREINDDNFVETRNPSFPLEPSVADTKPEIPEFDDFSRTSFAEALEQEISALRQEKMTKEAEEIAAGFRYGIYKKVVANWSRPPSARNGMEAKLLVELIPTGEVLGVTVLEGSDNNSFNQSAEAAVRKARRFEVPQQPRIFEDYFRKFTLLFKPEDLIY